MHLTVHSCACLVQSDVQQPLACSNAFTINNDLNHCWCRHRCEMFVCVSVGSGSRLLQPAQVCDMLKGLILVLCFSMMHYVDYSMMYHLIRGQSVIKLYIIYNMLEVPLTLAFHHYLTNVCQIPSLNMSVNRF